MGKEIMSRESIEGVFKAMPYILNFPSAKFWVDYDREADSEMLEDGVILRYRGDKMVGLTILDASKREKGPSKRRKAH
jgi:hypothetical protein